MTVRIDWLPGLSGWIVEYFQRLDHLTYLGGIWQEDLTTLLWKIFGHIPAENVHGLPRINFNKYFAPTWLLSSNPPRLHCRGFCKETTSTLWTSVQSVLNEILNDENKVLILQLLGAALCGGVYRFFFPL